MDDILDGLVWKTDWAYSDNYGFVPGSPAPEINRLSENYQRIYEWLSANGGGVLPGYEPLGGIGATTIPFAELLNKVEANIEALNFINAPDWLPGRRWSAMDPSPTYQDVNRWEQNGKMIADVIRTVNAGWRYCGMEYSGGM